jgi:hypothetical protein
MSESAKKLSPAQERLLDRLPLEIPAKIIGYGWRMPLGVERVTIEALERRGIVKTKIQGQGSLRKWIIKAA